MSKSKLLNYRVSGTGHPVVFIHGFLESNTMWDQLLPHLSNVKAYCIELSGHGNSQSFEGNLTIEKLAYEVVSILKKEKIDTFKIVGHSLGGYVALAILSINSELICEQLILLNSHPWEDSPIKKDERLQVAKIVQKNKSLFVKQAIPNLFQNPKEHKEAVEQLVQEALKMNSSDIATTTIAMRNRPSYENIIIKNNERSVIIQGEFDRLIPAQKMEIFCTKNNLQFINVKKAGHMVHFEQKETLIKILKRLLNCD